MSHQNFIDLGTESESDGVSIYPLTSEVSVDYLDEWDLRHALLKCRQNRPTTVIVTDSILKWCQFKQYADIVPRPGATLDKLFQEELKNNLVADWKLYRLCVIHCGTNDVDNARKKGKEDNVVDDVKSFTELIRTSNPRLQFVFSSIIHRPKDHKLTGRIIDKANRRIKLWTKSEPGIGYYPNFKSFIKNNTPLWKKYFGKDGLHMNGRGIGKLDRKLQRIIVMYSHGHQRILPPGFTGTY